jgi:tetratricopeptide (TPR) repeat protein
LHPSSTESNPDEALAADKDDDMRITAQSFDKLKESDKALDFHQSGTRENAVRLISAAIHNNPENPNYYRSLGDVLKSQGQLNQAMRCYQKSIQLAPQSFETYFKLGIAHHDQGNLSEAICFYQKAAHIKPDFVEALYNIGLAYQDLHRLEDALAYYAQAIQIKPDYAEAHNNKGKVYKDQGDLAKAVACFQQAIQLKADFAEPYFNLGDILSESGQLPAAIENYKIALRYRPDLIEAYNNLGNALKSQGDFDAAIENYRQVVRLKPNLAEAYYNLGSALRLKEDFKGAVANLRYALRLKSDYAKAYNNLGLAFKNQGDLDSAIKNFSQALGINPHLAEAHWNRSFVYLLQGEFKKGWQDYDWRFQQARWKTLYPHRYDRPRWDGSVCRDKTIFVHDEQGLGDTLQFVRYIPMVKSRCATVIFETRKSLIPLLKRFPGVDQFIIRSVDQPAAENWDFYIPLLSLPKIFNTQLKTIPHTVPYINAEPKKVEYWRQRLTDNGFKVGIVWAGRPMHTNDRHRSCALQQFLPFCEIPGIQLIGLQKGAGAAQVQNLPAEMGFVNFGEAFEDFSDTAGLIENLDLIISVDTAGAHLAGAMGKPVWVLLSFIPDWRWMMDREDSPWYPTMRLFRQKTHGGWEAVFQQVEKELRMLGNHTIESSQKKIERS